MGPRDIVGILNSLLADVATLRRKRNTFYVDPLIPGFKRVYEAWAYHRNKSMLVAAAGYSGFITHVVYPAWDEQPQRFFSQEPTLLTEKPTPYHLACDAVVPPTFDCPNTQKAFDTYFDDPTITPAFGRIRHKKRTHVQSPELVNELQRDVEVRSLRLAITSPEVLGLRMLSDFLGLDHIHDKILSHFQGPAYITDAHQARLRAEAKFDVVGAFSNYVAPNSFTFAIKQGAFTGCVR